MGAGIAAAIAMKEKRLIQHFRDLGAVSPDSAKSVAELRIDENFIFRRLHRRAVIRQVHEGEYYLDEDVWEAVRKTRHRIAFLIVAMIIIGLIMLYLNNGSHGAPLT
ncbi:MAG: hypothetical protein H0W69_08600 [Gemmatimonadaceae bacterium]|nr:hypothetical protein [Gemmatimonadaceae bacterium]